MAVGEVGRFLWGWGSSAGFDGGEALVAGLADEAADAVAAGVDAGAVAVVVVGVGGGEGEGFALDGAGAGLGVEEPSGLVGGDAVAGPAGAGSGAAGVGFAEFALPVAASGVAAGFGLQVAAHLFPVAGSLLFQLFGGHRLASMLCGCLLGCLVVGSLFGGSVLLSTASLLLLAFAVFWPLPVSLSVEALVFAVAFGVCGGHQGTIITGRGARTGPVKRAWARGELRRERPFRAKEG